ncbi:MAG TPA: DivIVA domain-containing protein [Mycobacteriales bacterium]|nr:DivIVA domain-containing protein [Mycobacteriales bacterium]
MPLELDDLTNVVFRKPAIGKRGYKESEVDEFLARVAATFSAYHETGSAGVDLVTPVDVHHVTFGRASFVDRGYNESDVDAFLDLVEAELIKLCEASTSSEDSDSEAVPAEAKLPPVPEAGLLGPDEVRTTEFGRPPMGKRGYDADEVDAFLERVEATLRGLDDLGASQVARVTFGKAPRGGRVYNEAEVDYLLDRIEETLQWREKNLLHQAYPALRSKAS